MMEEVDTLAPCSSATRLITAAQLLATPASNNTVHCVGKWQNNNNKCLCHIEDGIIGGYFPELFDDGRLLDLGCEDVLVHGSLCTWTVWTLLAVWH